MISKISSIRDTTLSRTSLMETCPVSSYSLPSQTAAQLEINQMTRMMEAHLTEAITASKSQRFNWWSTPMLTKRSFTLTTCKWSCHKTYILGVLQGSTIMSNLKAMLSKTFHQSKQLDSMQEEVATHLRSRTSKNSKASRWCRTWWWTNTREMYQTITYLTTTLATKSLKNLLLNFSSS